MANWSNPTVTTAYTDYTDNLKDRDLDVAKGMDPAVVTVTNPSTNMIRWNSANGYWEKYNGSAWAALTATYAIDISGTAGAVDFSDITSLPTTLAGYGITDAQALDADLTAVAGLSTTGVMIRTGSGTATTRSLAAPAAGITISNADGVSGNPTFALANDLNAVESMSTTGLAVRSATSTWVTRTLAQPAAGITVTNGDGVSGNPTLALADDLSAVEGLSGTGLAVRTASSTWANRTIAVSGTGLSITNADGVAGNPTITVNIPTFTTGDVKLTFKTAADSGWVMMNDGTIGDSASGATTRANADTSDLYTLLWTNVSDTWAAVSGGRGASAAADFAAHKTLALPKALGRALAIAGAGSGLTSRALGEVLGEETHTLTAAESGTTAHTHPDTIAASFPVTDATAGSAGTFLSANGTSIRGNRSNNAGTTSTQTVAVTGSVSASTAASAASAHNNMPPESFFNVMVKL